MTLMAGRLIGSTIGGLMDIGAAAPTLASAYGKIGLGVAGQGVGALGGSTFGQSMLKGAGLGLGGLAAKGIGNVLTGNGPIQRRKKAAAAAAAGGCSCMTNQRPQYSCEQKCQYGRMMAEKCKGCRGSSKYKKKPYKSSYTPYSYTPTYSSSPYSGSNWGVGGAKKPRVAARQNRRTARTLGRQTRRTNRQAARQARRARR